MNYLSPWIFTTYNCNLKCNYCYVKQEKRNMSNLVLFDVLVKFRQLLASKEKDFIILRLAGGEPLLSFDIWKFHVQDFLQNYPKKTSVGLISNLTLLTHEQIDFMKKNKFGYGISLDGWNFSKPYKNGLSSAERVRRNIDILNDYENTDISTVITSKSINDIDKLAKWIAKRNLNWGIYLDHYYDGEFNTSFLANKLFNVIDILFDYDYDIINKFKFNNIKLTKTYDGCTAGQNLIAIDIDGFVYDCQTAIYGTPTCYINNFKPRKKAKHITPSKCLDCPIVEFCRGGCKLNNNFGATCDLMLLIHSYILNKMEI